MFLFLLNEDSTYWFSTFYLTRHLVGHEEGPENRKGAADRQAWRPSQALTRKLFPQPSNGDRSSDLAVGFCVRRLMSHEAQGSRNRDWA